MAPASHALTTLSRLPHDLENRSEHRLERARLLPLAGASGSIHGCLLSFPAGRHHGPRVFRKPVSGRRERGRRAAPRPCSAAPSKAENCITTHRAKGLSTETTFPSFPTKPVGKAQLLKQSVHLQTGTSIKSSSFDEYRGCGAFSL